MKSEKMELRLINPNESGFLQHIEWNSEEIRKQVQMMMSAYTDVVYTEDTMKAAKDDRATLNKFKKVIEDRRKEVKKKCMEPYEQFEKEVKEITALIDKPIGMIDSQIKEYEEKQKAEKKSQIQAAYDESIGEFVNDLPFERVFDTRYLNATFSLSKAMSEVIEKIEKFKTDIATIDSLDSKHKLNVRDVYVRTLDLSQAMAEDRRLRELEERLEADRKAKEEAERKRQEAEAARREEALLFFALEKLFLTSSISLTLMVSYIMLPSLNSTTANVPMIFLSENGTGLKLTDCLPLSIISSKKSPSRTFFA